MSPDVVVTLSMLNLDCADPGVMARFYAALLNWHIPYCEPEYSMVSDGKTSIGFGRVEGYRPPKWPDDEHAKQYHLDFRVSDVAKAEARARELGASLPGFQPRGDRWRVMLDPEGHPVCLVPEVTGT